MCKADHIIGRTMVLLNKFAEHQGTPHATLGESFTLTELHLLGAIAANSQDNITELAARMGYTKGRASKLVSRLCAKGLVIKYKAAGNDKDVLLQLTRKGGLIDRCHREADKESLAAVTVFLDGLGADERKAIYEYIGIVEGLFDH